LKLKRLVVDDIRIPEFPATIARTAHEALDMIVAEHWDEVWLDHDADFVQGPDYSWTTKQIRDLGYKDQKPSVGLFVLHSANMHGRQEMRTHLQRWYKVIDIEQYPDTSLFISGADRVWDVSVRDGVHTRHPDGSIITLKEYYSGIRDGSRKAV